MSELRYGDIGPDEQTGSVWAIVEAWFADHPDGTVAEFTVWVTEATGVPWDEILTPLEQQRLDAWISTDPSVVDFVSQGLDGYP